MRGLGGRIEDEDEDGYLHDDMLKAAFGDIASYTAALVPIGGQAVMIPFNSVNDIPYDDTIVSSPSIEALETSLKLPFKLIKTTFTDGDYKGRQIRDIFSSVSIFSGIPVTPLGKTLGYLRDIQRGEVEPKGPLDLIRGIVTGKAGASKK